MLSNSNLWSVQQLNAQLTDANLVILDASIAPVGAMNLAPKRWPDCVIPRAKRFDIDKQFSAQHSVLPHTMPNASQFNQLVQQLAIDNDQQIVVYDDQGIFSSPRAWWMFKAMGHQQVAVLDGGLPAWVAEHYPTTSAITTDYRTGNFSGTLQTNAFCTQQQLLAVQADPQYVVLDARARLRFQGKVAEPRAGLRSGHIPNSKNLPYTELQAHGKFLTVDVLEQIFAQYVTKQQTIITSCGSGVTACVIALAAELCGYPSITVYDGSWAEWGQDPLLPCHTD